jgi:hypothetical protein
LGRWRSSGRIDLLAAALPHPGDDVGLIWFARPTALKTHFTN